MKSIFSTVLFVLLGVSVWAANLTATTSSTGAGLKTGKINLTITGGFGPYTILWSGPGGYSSTKVNPDSLAAGNYCVTVTDQYCGVAKLCVTVTEQGSSINELALNQTKIYPNPFTHSLVVELDEQLKSRQINMTLYDQLGRKVAHQQTVASSRIIWEFDKQIPAGVYILSIESEGSGKITRQVHATGK